MQIKYIAIPVIAALFLLVVFSTQERVYDERYHFKTYERLEEHGLSKSFFSKDSLSATGPGFFLMHQMLEPVTQLEMPRVRMVNTILLMILLGLNTLLFNSLKIKDPTTTALLTLGAPTIILAAGLAHTEMCAAVPFYCFLIATCRAHRAETSTNNTLLMAVLAGLCLALAVCTRQILAVAAIPLLLLPRLRKNIIACLLFVLTFVPLPLLLLLAWGGLTPPGQNVIGIKPVHGTLAFAYAGMFALIWNLSWLKWKLGWILAAVTGVIFVLVFPITPYVPWETMIGSILCEKSMGILGNIISRLWIVFGLYHFFWFIKQVLESRNKPEMQFLIAIAILVLFSAGFVTHIFSGRYVTTVVPLLVLIHGANKPVTKWLLLRYSVGAILGLAVVAQYIL